MAKRIFSTVLLWLIIFGVLWFFRTTGAVILIAAISALTLREFYQLMRGSGFAPLGALGVVLGTLITLAPWLQARFGSPGISHLLALAVVLLAILVLRVRDQSNRVEALASTLFGLVYVGLMLQYLVRIATPLPNDVISADGRLLLVIWIVAVAKFCDVGALLTGLAIGKHKMSPEISPKKTWEGAIGGVIISMGVSAFVAWLARGQIGPVLTPLNAALFAAPLAIVGIVSDLIESVFKRRATLKDSGAAIPGIGGIFDVSDSLILTAPLGYLLLRLP